MTSQKQARKPRQRVGVFDPGPLLRQVELTLAPKPGGFGYCCGLGYSMIRYRTFPDDAQIADVLGVSRRRVQRWKHAGVLLTPTDADRFACLVGLDASLLWPDWYEIEWDDDVLDAALANVTVPA